LGSHLPVVGGTRPERFSAFAITSHHSAACKRLTMASSSQYGFRFYIQTCRFRDRLVWRSRRVVSPMRAKAKSFVGAPQVPAFNPHLPRHGLALSRTADADPPRLIGWRSLHHRMPSPKRSLSLQGHRLRNFRLSSPAGSTQAIPHFRGRLLALSLH
jgi:hypothetical protein